MRIRHVRIAFQIFFFALFCWLVLATWLTRLEGWPVSLFLDMDPLVLIATSITTHAVYAPFHGALTVGSLGLIFGLILLVITMLFGRVFCNWMCPYGILHHFLGWIFNKRPMKERFDSNRYRPMYHIKYYVLGPYHVPEDAHTEEGLQRFRFLLEDDLIDLAAQSYREMGQPLPANLVKQSPQERAKVLAPAS